MDRMFLAKALMAGILIASVYVLVWLGKLDVNIYMTAIVTPVLTALGTHGALTTAYPPTQPTVLPPLGELTKPAP